MLMITRSQTPQAMRIAQAAQVFFLLFSRCFRSFRTRRQMLSIVGSWPLYQPARNREVHNRADCHRYPVGQ